MKRRYSALTKDFFMEIRKSMGRFLSIFFIVALGVSLFVGIRATEPDMRLSGDAYVDENKLMDIKIVSTYGLTEEDVTVVEGLPAIKTATGAYSADILCDVEGDKEVLHVMSHTTDMNLITISEGRLPVGIDECLVDKDFLKESGYKIGDKIAFETEADTDLADTFDVSEYTIVGSGSSPCYFALDRGNSTIGNGSVSGFVIVSPSAFSLDVYTEIFAMVDGAEETTAFTDEYDDLVKKAIEQIQMVQNVRCEVRRNDLAQNAQMEIDAARKELNDKKEEAEGEISTNKEELSGAELELKIAQLQMELGKQELEKAKAELVSGKDQLAQIKDAYGKAMEELNKEKTALEEEIASLEKQAEEMQDPIQQANLQTTIARLKTSLANLELQMSTLTEQYDKEIADAEKQIVDGEALIVEKEKELAKAEKELKKAQSDLDSGKEQIKDAEEELENQISEGETEIDEAEDEISDLELPVWYVFDRSSIPEYTGYGDNAERIAALAVVFPSIFFLVAALISLTTMTRMVEEQRVQIGTLKGLGYSNGAIMRKYMCYALLATGGGSIFGVLVGEKLFPYVIIVAYKIMYINIPHVLVPYHWGYGVVATLIAVVCTGAATLMACYKELVAQPAILMRPEAPKVGKRTWIERIPFLWKRLSFSWKSSLRNLFRYRKRFFMTLIGIGGCMGLLIVGYGLRDSITGVADLQYDELQTYELSVYVDDNIEEEKRQELETYLEENQSISSFMNARMMSVTTQYKEEKMDAYLTVVADLEHAEEFFVYRDRTSKKKYELTDDGVIISEKTAKMIGASEGDIIELTEDGMDPKQVKITAICENYVSHYVYMTRTMYEKVYKEDLVSNNVLIKTEASEKGIEHIGEDILKYESVMNVQYTRDLSAKLDDMLGALDRVMIVLIIVAGMLSFVVLYNLNNINITERRRELATLKVLGFYDMEVAMYVYRENLLLTLLGAIVGCGIGKFLHYFTISTVEVDVAMFGRVVYLSSYGIAALFTFGFSILVNLMMFFKLKQINMVESLKSVE